MDVSIQLKKLQASDAEAVIFLVGRVEKMPCHQASGSTWASHFSRPIHQSYL